MAATKYGDNKHYNKHDNKHAYVSHDALHKRGTKRVKYIKIWRRQRTNGSESQFNHATYTAKKKKKVIVVYALCFACNGSHSGYIAAPCAHTSQPFGERPSCSTTRESYPSKRISKQKSQKVMCTISLSMEIASENVTLKRRAL